MLFRIQRIMLPPSVSVPCVLWLITVVVAVCIHRFEQRYEDASFAQQANAAVGQMTHELNNTIQSLHAANQAMKAFAPVGPDQFREFARPLLQRYSFISAFSFHRIVPHSQRAQYEAAMRLHHPEFEITELQNGKLVRAGVRPYYRVIQYIEPATSSAILGMDSATRVLQTEAAKLAAKTGMPSATPMYRMLIQKSESPDRFLIMMPFYRSSAKLDSPESRQMAVIGYTNVVLRAREFFDFIFASSAARGNPAFDISVYAEESLVESSLAFRKGAAPRNLEETRHGLSGVLQEMLRDTPPDFRASLDVAGRPWQVVLSPHASPFVDRHIATLLALMAGVFAGLIASWYLRAVATRSLRIQRLVEQRTEELRRSNERLYDDIVARKRVEGALQESRTLLRQLGAHQETIKEEERKRIAREIHDELGQNLLALRIEISMLRDEAGENGPLSGRIGYALGQIDRTMKSVRSIINNLRPAVLDLGLHAAIEWQVKEFRTRSGIDCELRIDHEEFGMDDALATTLFRIVQESLTNVHRHAGASLVRVTLRREDDRFLMEIADNGVGIAPGRRTKGSFGLIGIEERVRALDGTFSLGRNADFTTVLSVTIPVGRHSNLKGRSAPASATQVAA